MTSRECDGDDLSWPGVGRQASTVAARGRSRTLPCGGPLASQCIQRTHDGRRIERDEVAARTLGLQLQLVPAVGPDDLASAFPAMAREHADALIVMPSPMLLSEYGRIASIAASSRLPAMGAAREFADLGGLMSYGVNLPDLARQTAKVHESGFGRAPRRRGLPVEEDSTRRVVD
jgi:hypothetical protein